MVQMATAATALSPAPPPLPAPGWLAEDMYGNRRKVATARPLFASDGGLAPASSPLLVDHNDKDKKSHRSHRTRMSRQAGGLLNNVSEARWNMMHLHGECSHRRT
jgi:hypothetical protein